MQKTHAQTGCVNAPLIIDFKYVEIDGLNLTKKKGELDSGMRKFDKDEEKVVGIEWK